ncbi:MAG: hypothetical protein ABII79_12730 [bacterium]
MAWNEGGANLFSGVVLNERIFINSTWDSALWLVRDYESPIPDAPYYNNPSEVDPLKPPWSAPQYEGATIPGAVTVALWDLYDALDDSNYYQGSTLWGHNNDSDNGEWWVGMESIWDVLTNYDPDPGDPNHDHCWTIYEFIQGWQYLGYPVNDTFFQPDGGAQHCHLQSR